VKEESKEKERRQMVSEQASLLMDQFQEGVEGANKAMQ
jgi:hypothetical protein